MATSRAAGGAAVTSGRRSRSARRPAAPGRRSGAASWSCRRRSARAARRTRRPDVRSRASTATVSPNACSRLRAGPQPWAASARQAEGSARSLAGSNRTICGVEGEADRLADRGALACGRCAPRRRPASVSTVTTCGHPGTRRRTPRRAGRRRRRAGHARAARPAPARLGARLAIAGTGNGGAVQPHGVDRRRPARRRSAGSSSTGCR